MKKLALLITLIAGGFYFYHTAIIKNHKEDIIKYDYAINNPTLFAFLNLEIDTLKWIEKYPSDFFKELALINNKRKFKISGWIYYDNEKITSAYFYNYDLGSIYLKVENNFTKITMQNNTLVQKTIELYKNENNKLSMGSHIKQIIKHPDIYNNYMYYTGLLNIEKSNTVKITTTLSIEELFKTKDIISFIKSEWWISSDGIYFPL